MSALLRFTSQLPRVFQQAAVQSQRVAQLAPRAAVNPLVRTYAIAVYHGNPEVDIATIRHSQPPTVSDEVQKALQNFTTKSNLKIKNASLLNEAVTSVHTNPTVNNRRLVALGESVVSHILLEHFHLQYPNLPAYSIRDLRNYLITVESLTTAASQVGLNGVVDVSSTDAVPAKQRSRVLPDTFYAVVAAVYLDQGSSVSHKFVRDALTPLIQGVDVPSLLRLAQPRAVLAKLLAQQKRAAPTTKVEVEKDANNRNIVSVHVYSGDTLLASASNPLRKKAELEAYRSALQSHFSDSWKTTALPTDAELFVLQTQA